MPCPQAVTPEPNVTVRSCSDPVDEVDWDELSADVEWRPRTRDHDPTYDGPLLEYCTGDGTIGQTAYSIDGTACALKLYDNNTGGWTQCYCDNRPGSGRTGTKCIRR